MCALQRTVHKFIWEIMCRPTVTDSYSHSFTFVHVEESGKVQGACIAILYLGTLVCRVVFYDSDALLRQESSPYLQRWWRNDSLLYVLTVQP